MRLTKQAAAQNRQRIVAVASRLFRERGLEGIGLSDLMKAAGFTHGGFYNHFASKEELAAEAVRHAFGESLGALSATLGFAENADAAFVDSVATFLAAEHRDADDGGCPTASMPIDVGRHGPEVQEAFAEGIEAYLGVMVQRMGEPGGEAEKRSMALLSAMVGALILSRAVKDARPDLSTALLDSVRERALSVLGRE